MPKTNQQLANAIARKARYGTATNIQYAIIPASLPQEGYVAERVRPGYRKYSTGEYVPMSYRAKFGWKNTYYQCAATIVVLPISLDPLEGM